MSSHAMDRQNVLKAAALIRQQDAAKELRATIAGGKHRLRLYAMTADETMESEIEIDDDDAAIGILSQIIEGLGTLIKAIGVKP